MSLFKTKKVGKLSYWTPLRDHNLQFEPLTVRLLPQMPVTVKLSAQEYPVSLDLRNGHPVFVFRDPGLSNVRVAVLNPFHLRSEFLSIQEPSEALEFFARSGAFRAIRPERDGDILEVPTPSSQEFTFEPEITWNEFVGWQQVVRSRMLYGRNYLGHGEGATISGKVPPLTDQTQRDFLKRYASRVIEAWLCNQPSDLHLEPMKPTDGEDETRLLLQIIAHRTLNAILATCYVDTLTNVKHGICELPDCMNLYQVTSKQPRQYCSNAHAHKAIVRRKREQARA